MTTEIANEELATYLDGQLTSLNVVPFGSEENLLHPGAIVSCEDFEEDLTLLGSYEGRIVARLRTVPELTSATAHKDLVEELKAELCDQTALEAALAGFFEVAELWNVTTSTDTDETLRETEISIEACLVQLA